MRACVRPFSQFWSVLWHRSPGGYAAILAALALLVVTPGSAIAQSPFGGTPWTIPGDIQAEDFDTGGQWVAYYDDSWGNEGGLYRATDVDIAGTPTGGGGGGGGGAGGGGRVSGEVN